MKSHVQFISTPTADTPGTALILYFDQKAYLFGNIHEGTQRTSIQRAAKLTKVSNIFLTGKTEWKNTGGLLGMILTLADSTATAAVAAAERAKSKLQRRLERELENPNSQKDSSDKSTDNSQVTPLRNTLTIHGGPNLTHTLATARRFVFRKGMPVYVNEIQEPHGRHDWEPTWSDENIRVWAMSIEPNAPPEKIPIVKPELPCKRSFDEIEDQGYHLTTTIPVHELANGHESVDEQADHDQQIRKAVVSHMFHSEWRLDALVETPLEHVHLPATIYIRDPESKKLEKYTGPLPGDVEPLPERNVLVRRPWPAALVETLPSTKPSNTSISYIFRNHPQRGAFLPQKALALKVTDKRLWTQLAAGKAVQSGDGNIINPEEVLSEGKEGGGVAVIDLPTREYIQSLIDRPEWKAPEVMVGVEAVIWILGPGVGEDKTLRNFMTDFKHLKHIVSSQDYCTNYISLDSSASAAIRLNQVDPIRYPIPVHDNVTLPQLGQAALGPPLQSDWITAKRGMTVQLEPAVIVKEDSVVPLLNTAIVLQEISPEVLSLAEAAKREISSAPFQDELQDQKLPSPEAEIICLGTGSALPSKYRNVSATLLRVPGSGSYLLDCGENTLGQLKRVYDADELQEVLRDLKLIWISHLHADHHLGITSVIKAWYEANYGLNYSANDSPEVSFTEQLLNPAKILREEKRLFVVSATAMIKWLEDYASVEDYGFDKLVPLSVESARPKSARSTYSSKFDWNSVPLGFNRGKPEISSALKAATGLSSLAAANVNHCRGAMAVSLTFPTGFKFSYSGDCRPSKSFAKIGQGSTVLLHEATFDDELQTDAEAKKHSTTSEAIGVGVAMGARRVLLTHFSQRYQKVPVMEGWDMTKLRLEDEDADADTDADVNSDTGDAVSGVDPEEIQNQDVNFGKLVENEIAMEDILDSNTHAIDANDHRSRSGTRSTTPIPNANSSPASQTPVTKGSLPFSSRHSSSSSGSIAPLKPPLDMKIGVCFDYMRVKVRDIAVLEKFTPALLKLYEEPEKVEKTGEVVGDNGAEGDGEKGKKSAKAEKQNKNIQQTQQEKQVKNKAAISPSLPTAFVASVAAHSRPWLVDRRGKAKEKNANKRNYSTCPSLPTAFLTSVAAHSTPLLVARNMRKRQSMSNSLPTAFLASVAAHSQPLPVVAKGNANKRHSRGDGRRGRR